MKVDEKAPIEGNSRTRSHLEDSNNAGAAAMETLEIGEEVVLKGVAWSHEYLIEYPIRGADEQVGELPMKVPYGGLEEEPHQDGVGVMKLTSKTIDGWLTDHDVTLVVFSAPWCTWCERLLPTLHATADVMGSHAAAKGVSIATVDCLEEEQLCIRRFGIKAFPTAKAFLRHELQTPDYTGYPKVAALSSYLLDMANRTSKATAGMTTFKQLVRPGLIGILFPKESDVVDCCSEMLLDAKWNRMTSDDRAPFEPWDGSTPKDRGLMRLAFLQAIAISKEVRAPRAEKLPDSWVEYPVHGPNEPVEYVVEEPCENWEKMKSYSAVGIAHLGPDVFHGASFR